MLDRDLLKEGIDYFEEMLGEANEKLHSCLEADHKSESDKLKKMFDNKQLDPASSFFLSSALKYLD